MIKTTASICGGVLFLLGGQPCLAGLPPSTEVFGPADFPLLRVAGFQRDRAALEPIEVAEPAFSGPGLRITVRTSCDSPLAAQIVATNPRPIEKGHTLWAHFFLRTTSSEVESGEGKIQVVLENATTFDKSLQFTASAAREWKEFAIPFVATESFVAGAASVIARVGYHRQTVELADFRILDFGSGVKKDALPFTRNEYKYEGMEDDAPWRAAALARIEEIRKAPLRVTVVDRDGRPAPQARVDVTQLRHAYFFGSAVDARLLVSPDANVSSRYRDLITKLFNIVTFQNDLKWAKWQADSATPLAAARWCKENDIALRGHTLVWPSWRKLPPEVKSLQGDPTRLKQTVLDHIKDEATALAPYVYLWDVVNEPFDNHDITDILGRASLGEWFQATHEAAPQARLFLNDYGIITGNGLDLAHQRHFSETIQDLIGRKAPLDGLGIQGHFGQELTAPPRILEILDRYAAFNLPIQITEFSLQVEDPQKAAHYLRDVLTVFFSHPSTNAFLLWGFIDDGAAYKHTAVLYDAKGNLTECGRVWQDLVQHAWWTNESLPTNAEGTLETRAFLGRYEITVHHGDEVVKQQLDLDHAGSSITVTLP